MVPVPSKNIPWARRYSSSKLDTFRKNPENARSFDRISQDLLDLDFKSVHPMATLKTNIEKWSPIFIRLFSALRGSWDFIFGRINLIHLLDRKNICGLKIFSFYIFSDGYWFFWCVCGGTEIAGILVCSTFAEALGQELAVKIHRKVWWKLKILNSQIFFYSSKCIRPILPNMKSQLPLTAENKSGKCGYTFFASKTRLNTFGQCPHRISTYGCRRIWDFPGIFEMCPTLGSCISELKTYFLMGPVLLQRSMSKL